MKQDLCSNPCAWHQETHNDGHLDGSWNYFVLCAGNWIHVRMRAFKEMTMHTETAIILIISVFLLGYLVYALLQPEKF